MLFKGVLINTPKELSLKNSAKIQNLLKKNIYIISLLTELIYFRHRDTAINFSIFILFLYFKWNFSQHGLVYCQMTDRSTNHNLKKKIDDQEVVLGTICECTTLLFSVIYGISIFVKRKINYSFNRRSKLSKCLKIKK